MDQQPNPERHAVVIGGSIAGMAVARVLAPYFDRVTILERDRLPSDPERRPGLPQGRHLHVLLTRGMQIITRLFPTIEASLIDAGAVKLDIMAELASLTTGGWMPRIPSPYQTVMATRPLLDWIVRQHLAAFPNLSIRESSEVIGLLPLGGVRIRTRDGNQPEYTMPASLVVDTSGRDARAPQWFEALGYLPPTDTIINSFLGYATRMYEPPADWQADWKSIFIMNNPPVDNRGGALFLIEGHRWLVTLAGAAHDYPPTDEAGFLEFIRSLRSPLLYDAIKQATPLTPIAGYQRTENRLRHYEKLPDHPERFIALGDAVCAFNPIYGQGMTAALMGAALLGEHLRDTPDPSTPGWAARFQRRLAKQNEPIWMLATSQDFRSPSTVGGHPTVLTKWMHWYVDQFNHLISDNIPAAKAFIEVLHLLQQPTRLFAPRFMVAILKNRIRRAFTNSPDRERGYAPVVQPASRHHD